MILKDETPGETRDDGRERAGISWEAEFPLSKSGKHKDGKAEEREIVWVPWSALKPTYRGKEKQDAGKLKLGEIRRLGFMMRRYVSPWVAHFGYVDGLCTVISARSKETSDWNSNLYVQGNSLLQTATPIDR